MATDDSVGPGPSAAASPETHHESGRTFLGQPRGLANLFSVELWERFSFYGMQGIVLLYMYFQTTDGGLGIDEGVAAGVLGAYGGSVYLFSILGGWVADRLLGSERTMLSSAVLIMLGHTSLAVLPGLAGLAAGLLLIAVGSGGLKATITNLVGTLYSADAPRRDAGFSIFYMGSSPSSPSTPRRVWTASSPACRCSATGPCRSRGCSRSTRSSSSCSPRCSLPCGPSWAPGSRRRR